MTRITNAAPGRPERQQRGLAASIRATGRGITVRDNGVDVEPVWDILLGQGLKATDLDDGAVRIDAGGGDGSSGNFSSPPVPMLNNSGQTLLPGDVVVVDDTADQAVTVTTEAGDIRIAGVVLEPIDIGAIGPVLFNGFAPVINAPGSVRGEYAQTSTTATEADATTDREPGSFAVYLTGTDFADFVVASATTTQPVGVLSLDIDMPPAIPANRTLFLALWLEDSASSIAIDGWTRIGSEAGFYYFRKVSEGDDTATATWTGVSVAVASVLLLHENVALGFPLEDHDYDDTTSAATVGSLSGPPKYAIAGVQDFVATPDDDYVFLAGGVSDSSPSGTPTLVQSKQGDHNSGGGDLTFDSTLTAGNMMLSITHGEGADTWQTDVRVGGCVIDANTTSVGVTDTNNFGSSGINSARIQAKNISAADLYSGPFGTFHGCTSGSARLFIAEFSGISLDDYEVVSLEGTDTSPIDLGTFAGVGPNDLLVMVAVMKKDGFGLSPDPTIGVNGFTQVTDNAHIVNGWAWSGYKVGDGDASITYTPQGGGWGAAAVLFRQTSSIAEGTLAGKYIGSASSATSPFDGVPPDAIFAINLTADAKPSALLYGPDLAESGVSELDDLTDVTITSPTEDDHLQYVGGQWVNNQRYRADVTDGFDTFVWEGDELVWEWSS